MSSPASLPAPIGPPLPCNLPVLSLKQEQIIQGALRVFLRSGYAGTSMDQVAAEAGVAKQTLYTNFQDKNGLFTALLEWMTIRRFQVFQNVDRLHGEPEVLLRQLAETYLTEIATADYVGLVRLVIAESERFPDLAKLFTQTVVQRGRAILAQYFEQHPELGIHDPQAMAMVFFGALVSYVVQQEILYGKELMPLGADRLIDSLMTVMLAQKAN
jgi:AcrR family transcriptional regulator